jgi:hypothetical protein
MLSGFKVKSSEPCVYQSHHRVAEEGQWNRTGARYCIFLGSLVRGTGIVLSGDCYNWTPPVSQDTEALKFPRMFSSAASGMARYRWPARLLCDMH